jgi:hypothetical protein
VATQTALIPDLLSEISDMLTGPTPAITLPLGAGSSISQVLDAVPTQSAGLPDLLSQISSLLACITDETPQPTPSVPFQGLPTRAGGSDASFLTSVTPVFATVTPANPTESPTNWPVPTLNTTLAACVPEPIASVFDPHSPENVAVYFGQPGTEVEVTLLETCADPNVDIVVLGFLTDVTYDGIYPRLQLVRSPSPQPTISRLTIRRVHRFPARKPPR